MSADDPHYIYLLFCGDEIVYVGVTCNLEQRLKQHSDKVYTRVQSNKLCNKYYAMHVERKLLIQHVPKYNWVPHHLRSHPELGKLKSKKKVA